MIPLGFGVAAMCNEESINEYADEVSEGKAGAVPRLPKHICQASLT